MNEKIDYKEEIERPIAVFETNMGVFEVELFAKECPETAWNFINLAEGRQETERGGNFYDGLTFHRIIQGFMIQAYRPQGQHDKANGCQPGVYRRADILDSEEGQRPSECKLKHDAGHPYRFLNQPPYVSLVSLIQWDAIDAFFLKQEAEIGNSTGKQ